MPAIRAGAVVATISCFIGALPAAHATGPPPVAVWHEEYFASGDGTRLHADVLRPAGLAADVKTPVILTVSPYTNHAAGTITDYDPDGRGPSHRFYDFLDLGDILERGYTYVMVDLPGTGGSSGCTDWGGPAEQAAVKAAVEWAAAQPWSTGRVGVIGKSYDGWTGLMAIANRPMGLAAVVSMEPVFAGYRYLYMNGVRFTNSVRTPASFALTDATPGGTSDTPEYHLNGTGPNAGCYALTIGQHQLDEPDFGYWRERDLIEKSRGATTPLFLTQGFLETNTRPDGAFDYYDAMAGPKRAWFGQFDHVRGWEAAAGEPLTGRHGFIDETMRFLDHYVKGVPLGDAPTDKDPPVAVQGIDGRYRSEADWPPADAQRHASALRPGSYADDGQNRGTGRGAGRGLWSISQPLPHRAHLAGEPVLEAEVETTVPRANLVANVYDIDQEGFALMISRGAYLLRGVGRQRVRFALYGQDWPLPEGHRLGVVISGSNSEWWDLAVPTRTDVNVMSASLELPFLRYARAEFIEGSASARLEGYLWTAGFTVPATVLAGAETSFKLPPPQDPHPPSP